MNTLRKRSLACLMLLLGILSLTAFAGNVDRTGSAGAQELLIPVGARGIGLGAASMISLQGVEAIYYNPAGLGRMEHSTEAMMSYMSYFADIGVTYGAIGVKAGSFGTLGFSIKSINLGDIPVTTETFPDGTGQTYSPTLINIGVAYANQLTDRISVGVNTTIISESVMSTSATGLAFDIGVQYFDLGISGLDLGVAVKNVGPNMRFGGSNLLRTATGASDSRGAQTYQVVAATFDLPTQLEIGIGYRRKIDEKNTVFAGGLFRNNNTADDEYSLGAEYVFNNLVSVRGNYILPQSRTKDATGANTYLYDYSLGLGLHYLAGDLDLTIDYAYRHMNFFTGNNVITLRLGF